MLVLTALMRQRRGNKPPELLFELLGTVSVGALAIYSCIAKTKLRGSPVRLGASSRLSSTTGAIKPGQLIVCDDTVSDDRGRLLLRLVDDCGFVPVELRGSALFKQIGEVSSDLAGLLNSLKLGSVASILFRSEICSLRVLQDKLGSPPDPSVLAAIGVQASDAHRIVEGLHGELTATPQYTMLNKDHTVYYEPVVRRFSPSIDPESNTMKCGNDPVAGIEPYIVEPDYDVIESGD